MINKFLPKEIFLKNKTILHFTGMISTKYGALERFFLCCVECSKALGFNTVLQYEELPWSKTYLDDLDKAGAELILKPINTGALGASSNIYSILSSVKPDVVNVHFVEPLERLMIALMARLIRARRTVAMVHNKPEWNTKRLGALIFNLYDYVLPVSDSVKDSLVIGGVQKRKIHTHYLGVYVKGERSLEIRNNIRKQLNIPEEAILLSTIAFDAPFKGLDILLNALSIVVTKRPDVYWMSVGVNMKKSSLPSLAADLGVADHIRWVGIVDDGWAFLSAADLYVQSSRSAEGGPLAILEAMAMRLPVLCTRICGYSKAIKNSHCGSVVDPEAKSLAQGILELIDNRSKWKDLTDEAYKRFAELFDGKVSVENLVNKYYL